MLIELERPDAEATLGELSKLWRATDGDVRAVVRAAAYGLSYQVKLGDLDLHDADTAVQRLSARWPTL